MRAALILTVASLAAVLLALLAPAGSEGQTDDAPELTFSSPADGATIGEPPFVIQLCFAQPVSTQDLTEGDDFFVVTAPGDFRLGLRIVFQGDGFGVAVYANNADADTPEGEWTVDYHVSSPDTPATTEGQIVFTVGPGGEELSQATPPRCLESGFTATPGPSPSETEPPASTTAASETPAPGNDESDDDSDALLIVLLVLGAAGGVALIVGIGYQIRRRRTQEPQATAPDDEPGT